MKTGKVFLLGLLLGAISSGYLVGKSSHEAIKSLHQDLRDLQTENDSLTNMYTELNAACQQEHAKSCRRK